MEGGARNVKKRKLRSPVWEYFEASSDRSVARCKLCNSDDSFTTGDPNTTTLMRHLKFSHGVDIKESQLGKVTDDNNPTAVFCKEEKIARLAAEDGLSFNQIASSKTLRELFAERGVTNYPLSAGTVSSIVQQYALCQNNLKKKLEVLLKNGLRFSLTMDEWTSAGRKRYMNVNLHAHKGQIFNLGLIRIFGSFTAENAMQLLVPKLEMFGVNFETDVVGLATDGAWVMKKIGREFKIHQLYLAHGIHLAAVCNTLYKPPVPEHLPSDSDSEQDEDSVFQTNVNRAALNDQYYNRIIPVVSKVRKLVKMFQKSSLKNEKLKSYTRGSHGKELNVILDCKSRWSSLFYMLERFDFLVDEIDFKMNLELTAQELQLIKDMIDELRPLESVTRTICANDATLLTAEMSIQYLMGTQLSQKSTISNQLYGSVKSCIKERRGLIVDTLRYLHLTGTKKSRKIVESHFEPKPKEKITRMIEKIYKSLEKDSLTQSQGLESEDTLDETPVSPSILFFEKDLKEFLEEAMESPKIVSSRGNSITEKIAAEIASLEKGGGRGAILEKVYIHLQSLPPSTVEAERVFSCANGFCSRIRSRLGDNSIDSLVFLKHYFKRNQD